MFFPCYVAGRVLVISRKSLTVLSNLFWLQCECISCYSQPDSPYYPSNSSTYYIEGCDSSLCKELPPEARIDECTVSGGCEYVYEPYGDGSTTQGVLASDVLTLGSSKFEVKFGCGQINLNRGAYTGSDGIVGFGRGPVSIISQIGNNFGRVFSYCLVSFYSSPTKTSPLIFGQSGGSYKYTPLIIDSKLVTASYYVTLRGILVNSKALSIPAGTFDIYSNGTGGIILDSGMIFTLLQKAAYAPLLKEVKSLIKYPEVNGSGIGVGLDACYRPGVPYPSWPKVTFQFQDVEFTLPDGNLFILVDNVGDYCMAIQGSNFPLGIFGNVQQQNFNIQFDVAKSRVGFSGPTIC